MWCKPCHIVHNNKWTKANPTHVKKKKKEFYYADLNRVRDKELRHKFGITKEIYDSMLLAQNNVCAICKQPETSKHRDGKVRRLAVDHCHTSNRVRNLLCNRCNKGIGIFKDDPSLLNNAFEYVYKWSLK